MNANRYYEALLEGRYRPTIEVTEREDGKFVASFTDGQNHRVEVIDDSSTFAHSECVGLVRMGVRNGELLPF